MPHTLPSPLRTSRFCKSCKRWCPTGPRHFTGFRALVAVGERRVRPRIAGMIPLTPQAIRKVGHLYRAKPWREKMWVVADLSMTTTLPGFQ